ncbi:hypothetical protein EVAR_53663_1 [Eumeta japonica]|uniref:Uncharacterized protein n=1 Tax=Eumeta variegata TaxID=151549 RepID=A0A4C1ZYM0_EUMVA|nr:hypothetical protein EVAR_53663_1 [Eumeta japonica]
MLYSIKSWIQIQHKIEDSARPGHASAAGPSRPGVHGRAMRSSGGRCAGAPGRHKSRSGTVERFCFIVPRLPAVFIGDAPHAAVAALRYLFKSHLTPYARVLCAWEILMQSMALASGILKSEQWHERRRELVKRGECHRGKWQCWRSGGEASSGERALAFSAWHFPRHT